MTALSIVVAVSGSMVAAQDFQKGIAATEAGDYATAVKELLPLAEQGNAAAQYYLGLMYNDGNGVPQDHAEAVKWYCLAAEQGNTSAQFFLALMYDEGDGVLQDNVAAHMWFNIGSANGKDLSGKWRDDMAELQQKRDEIKLQLKLGSMETEEEWDSLVSEWDEFLSASQFERSAEEVGEAAREMGLKMKIAYDRAKNAVG